MISLPLPWFLRSLSLSIQKCLVQVSRQDVPRSFNLGIGRAAFAITRFCPGSSGGAERGAQGAQKQPEPFSGSTSHFGGSSYFRFPKRAETKRNE